MTQEELELAKRERLAHLKAKKDWLEHPTTTQYLKKKQEEVMRINNQLMNDETLTEEKRLRLFAERKAHQYDLAEMTTHPEDEIVILKRQLNEL